MGWGGGGGGGKCISICTAEYTCHRIGSKFKLGCYIHVVGRIKKFEAMATDTPPQRVYIYRALE